MVDKADRTPALLDWEFHNVLYILHRLLLDT